MRIARTLSGLDLAGFGEDGGSDVEAELAYLLDLRRRSNPTGRVIIDRCLALVARSVGADPESLAAVHREMLELADELAARFGAPCTFSLQ